VAGLEPYNRGSGIGEDLERVMEIGERPTPDLGQRNLPLPGHDACQPVRRFRGVIGVGEVEDVSVDPTGKEVGVLVRFPLVRWLNASTKGTRMVA
jgi:hypothetical protein